MFAYTFLISPVPDLLYLKVVSRSVESFLKLNDLLRHLVLSPGLARRSLPARDWQFLRVSSDGLPHLHITSCQGQAEGQGGTDSPCWLCPISQADPQTDI